MSLDHMRQDKDSSRTVAVVGEVLFDHFPDGKKVLGGAPFNVAWNLQGLGLEPLFVSAIGDDSEGQAVLAAMRNWRMRTEGVHVSSNRSTGKVIVTMEDCEPVYEIPLDQAFDRLAFADVGSDLNDSFSRATLIYHGSLVFRTPANQHFYQQLIERLKLPRFVDLNIRQPWFDESQVRTLVAGAKWVKLNIHELNYLADANADPAESKSIQSAIMKFRAKENLTERQTFLVTCGEHGAWWIDEENVFFASSIEIDSFVDSVGAGDAFSSAAIHGILKSQSPKSILQSAVRFAASACEIKGATTQNAGHYARHTELDSIELEPASPAQRDESG